MTAGRAAPRSPYLALASVAVQQSFAYRGSTFMSLVGNGIWIAVVYYLWRAVYAGAPAVAGYGWLEMRTYIVLAYAVNALLSFSSTMRLLRLIRTGDVAQELLRPVDYMGAQLALSAGAALVEGMLSAGLALAVGVLVVGIAPPASAAAALLFLPSVALGFLIKFLVSFLVSLLCFYTLNSVGLVWAQTALVSLLSGALVPIAFFPGWLQAAVRLAPFQGIVNAPLEIYLGRATGWGVAGALALQAAWVAALWLLARALWAPASRALEIQGG